MRIAGCLRGAALISLILKFKIHEIKQANASSNGAGSSAASPHSILILNFKIKNESGAGKRTTNGKPIKCTPCLLWRSCCSSMKFKIQIEFEI